MDVLKYNRVVVNTNIGPARSWKSKYKSVPMRIFSSDPSHIHPLVKSNDAYWVNSATLCVGYTMLDNGDIFRPIFNHMYQRMIDEFQPHIARAVNKRAEKMAYLEVAKIKKLPIELVDEIISFAH